MPWTAAGPFRGLLAVVMAIPLLAGPVGAQQPPAQVGVELPAKAMRQIETLLEAKEQRTPAQRKVISQLLDAARQQSEPSVSARQQAAETDPVADPEPVTVDIRADVTPDVLERIRALGGTVVNSIPRYQSIRARLPLAALEPLATLEAVQFIRPADQPIMQGVLERSAGARAAVVPDKVDTSEGDVAHQADVARQTYTVDGTGIGIGVISDGVETLADQQATGDVPTRVMVLPGQEGGSFDLACGGRSSGTEGTAMIEIVHDLAPGADLFFADGGGGRAQMAQNIEDLCAAGADIIVDDIGYLGASAFQDDVIAQAISAAAANGCFYFSSAGNAGNLNDATAGVWEGDFVSGGTLSLNGISAGAVVHDFGGGVTGNRIKTNSTRPIILQWADPVDGSANDYDLFLIDEDDNVLASSTSTQDGTQDPIEYIGRSCSNDREDTRLVIVKNSGAEDRYVRLNYGRGTLELATAGQTFGHSASQDAIGVAAVDVGDAGGAGGVFDGTESVETFSSDGPRRIFFESDGTPITPGNFSSTGGRVLQKPDLAAADAVSTSTPGFSTFKGTSAAAPHAAAIAALMLEAAGGPDKVTTTAELRTAMTGAALDIEETGVDRDSGAGIVMAPGAVDAVDVALADRNGAPTVVSTPAVRTLAAGGAAVTVDVASVFSDADQNDTLTYTALSSDPGSLEISLTGSMLTLTPRSPGSVIVAVRATDSSGLSVTNSVSVTVVPLVLSAVTLNLSSSSIGENGGVSTVTARLDRASAADTTLLVGATAVDPATSNDFMLSANRVLTITAGQTASAGTVTITANNNDEDAPNKTITVSAAVDNADGVTGPSPVTLTIRDDDAAPAVTLKLTPSSIGENRGVSTVTASLDRASGADTTVTVSAMAVAPAESDDFMLSTNQTLTIAAGRTDSTGTVTVRAVDNNVDAPNKEVRVSATADNSHGVAGNPSPATLTITDDDDGPELTLAVRPSAIAEDGGVSTVTVESVNGVAFAQDQRIDLAFAGTAAKGTDYTVALERLTLAAGQTSVDTTVTAADDGIDDDAETVLVTARHGGGVLGAERTITIDDDDDAPVIQTASPILVVENETAVATLEATDADLPAEDLTWRIAGGADRNRFRLTSDGELTFRAAPDYENPNDSDRNRDYEVTVEVSDGANPVDAVFTIRLEDVDDTAPVFSSASVNGATLTLTYGEALDGNSRPAASDFTVSGGNSARTVSNVAVSGRAVTLTLDPAVEHGETGIRVTYRPGTNPIQDAAGNDAVRLSNQPVTNNTGDTTAPTVSRVEITSRPERSATYAAGKEIAVTVTFSETVVVTGTPRLTLNVGGIDRTAAFRSGTGAAVRFAYAVADGESDGDGVSVEANSLSGTIRDGANNNALLTHDGLAADARHKVDGVKPALVANGGAVVNGATLTLTYGEALDGSSRPVALAFTVNVEGAERRVSRVAVSGSAVTLTLDPPVAPNQTVRLTYRVPGANPIQDIAGNDARPLTNLGVENHTLDTTAPRVSRVAIASNPGPDGIYAEGDVMEATVTFSETVQVDTTNGTPTLALRVGRPTKPATYDRGSNSDRLVFSYMVADGDLDTDGVNIAAGRIALNRGTIADLADNPAILVYEAVPPQPGHAVDGVRPELQGAMVSGDTLTLTYREALDEDSTPAGGDFTVDVAGAERPLTEVLVSGSTVALTLDSPVTPGQTVTVSYTPGTRPIQDAAGNAAEDLTEYTAGTPPPIIVRPPPPPPPPTTGGGGGGGGGRARPPSYPGTVRAEGGDGEVTLTWNAPSSQGSSRIQYYEYRIDGEGEWISTGSSDRTHTIAGLINGRVYFFHLRAVSAAGAGSHRISPEATPVADLDFTHFANGGFITSTLALVNAGAYPVRPAIYFYDQDGDPITARRVVDLTPDLEILDDGALSPRTVMNPLSELTIATHGRGGQRVGSVTVRAPSSIGGVLRFDIPGLGVAGVGDSPTIRDALVPVRRQVGGINTGVAVRNRGTATLTLQCRLMRDGAVVEEADIRLKVNGQDSRFIDEVFPAPDTSDFAGSVRCAAPEPGRFSAVAFELDGVNRIFTTLPVVPVPAVPDQEQEEEQEQDATRLDFTHFANGGKIVSSLVLVNAGTDPVRPAIYFHDQDGDPIVAESLVDITEDLEVGDDGALRPSAAINPLGELTISTHGRGGQVVGSAAVVADGPIGGVLRFDIPGLGVAGVGDSPPVRDALVPVRRQDGGINTGVAVHNRGATALLVRCRLMRAGVVLEETMIPLAANGQDSRFIDQVFPGADTSDFAGSVRCMTPEPGRFSAVAFELDGVNRIFTTLPVVPVVDVP